LHNVSVHNALHNVSVHNALHNVSVHNALHNVSVHNAMHNVSVHNAMHNVSVHRSGNSDALPWPWDLRNVCGWGPGRVVTNDRGRKTGGWVSLSTMLLPDCVLPASAVCWVI
ncbi:MAG: hypothetical protein OSA98_20310, partial [Rubripirellula sp.]|nr:hypothetical protein [Rubripirellula sp.]